MIDESILKLLKDSFSTSVQTVYIPTIGKTLRFREPTFKEQKTISKIVVANPDKQSVIYASTLAMISNLCLDDIDISSLNEYDRLKILAFLFSMNFFSKRIFLILIREIYFYCVFSAYTAVGKIINRTACTV